MKKYVILKANGCHGYWSYMAEPRPSDKQVITTPFFDRFLCTDVKDAVLYNTEEEAEEFLNKLGMVNAIFRIEKIYIIK